MNYRIVITARAKADAVEAFRWIANQSPSAAARWYDGLFRGPRGEGANNPTPRLVVGRGIGALTHGSSVSHSTKSSFRAIRCRWRPRWRCRA